MWETNLKLGNLKSGKIIKKSESKTQENLTLRNSKLVFHCKMSLE